MAKKYSKLEAGTQFMNGNGEVVEILEYSHYQNRNHYYEVMNKETAEIKTVQHSNLVSGSFSFSRFIYENRELYSKLRRAYDHILERIRKKKSYVNVENDFGSFKEFYQFFIFFFEDNPEKYNPFLEGKLEIDKDLISEILIIEGRIRCRKYSKETIILVSKAENSGIVRKLCNIENVGIRKEKLYEFLKKKNFRKYQKIKKSSNFN